MINFISDDLIKLRFVGMHHKNNNNDTKQLFTCLFESCEIFSDVSFRQRRVRFISCSLIEQI